MAFLLNSEVSVLLLILTSTLPTLESTSMAALSESIFSWKWSIIKSSNRYPPNFSNSTATTTPRNLMTNWVHKMTPIFWWTSSKKNKIDRGRTETLLYFCTSSSPQRHQTYLRFGQSLTSSTGGTMSSWGNLCSYTKKTTEWKIVMKLMRPKGWRFCRCTISTRGLLELRNKLRAKVKGRSSTRYRRRQKTSMKDWNYWKYRKGALWRKGLSSILLNTAKSKDIDLHMEKPSNARKGKPRWWRTKLAKHTFPMTYSMEYWKKLQKRRDIDTKTRRRGRRKRRERRGRRRKLIGNDL